MIMICPRPPPPPTHRHPYVEGVASRDYDALLAAAAAAAVVGDTGGNIMLCFPNVVRYTLQNPRFLLESSNFT